MFHVPEASRLRTHPLLGSSSADGNNGAFFIGSPEPGWTLALICSDDEGWEHVSVRAVNDAGRSRTPSWKEMCWAKDVCWDAEDEVIQFHPRRSEYVNCHPHVLHLWRSTSVPIPRPEPALVGPL